jgi:two-component system cell cycle sensor histidine kinase/response regulator CckA
MPADENPDIAALRRSEERYRQFVERDITGNLMMRADGRIETCNLAFVQMFGFESSEQARSSNFFSLLQKNGHAELLAPLHRGEMVERQELEMRQRDGRAVHVVARFVGRLDKDAQLEQIDGYFFDDTKRKRLEQQLIQAQKMEGLGTLAGGIAHDFNNILGIILGYTARIEEWQTRPDLVPGSVKIIKDAVDRGAVLVQQLLISARQSDARFASVDLNAAVRELEKMVAATFPKMISFVLHLQPRLPLVTADRNQIHKVLLNLCVNARDALPTGGTITLETALAAGPAVAEIFPDAAAARYACVRVIDSGTGMSNEVKPRIFEPFYTTKERGKGTGLGLSVVYGVVRNHEGFVRAESEPNQGTTFSIYLPLASAAKSSDSDGETGAAPETIGAQTVLLVEDEDMLRDLGVQMLENDGFRVLAARDGIEALEIFAEYHDEIGLVICDLGLPRLGGREVFRRMKESKPNVRVIVASGYLEPGLRSEMLKAGVLDTIQKPYDFRELVKKIRSITGDPLPEREQPRLF